MSEEEKEAVTKEKVEKADDTESLRRVLDEERAKAEKYLANWQRAQADFINLKRRTEQERNEVARFANGMLIASLLPVLDDLERALDAVSAKLAGLTWVEGIRLVFRKFKSILEAQGLSEIKALGEDFDPSLHEAVMHAEGEEGKVVAELQKGYKVYDRVIRPTMVVVGRGGEKTQEQPTSEEE